MKVLFVCATNICRSPYAEYVFRRIVSEDARAARMVEWVRSGAVSFLSFRMSPKAEASLLREGFAREDIRRHRPRLWLFAPGRFAAADVIVGMTRLQGWLLPFWWRRKYITLSEAATGSYRRIPDPVLMGPQEYDAVMRSIREYLAGLKERLPALTGRLPGRSR